MSVELNSLLERRPGVNGGRLCLAGTGTSVRQMAVCFQQGYSAEEIASELYPHLELAKVHAAVAYYLANRDEIDAELRAEEEEYERLRREHPIC